MRVVDDRQRRATPAREVVDGKEERQVVRAMRRGARVAMRCIISTDVKPSAMGWIEGTFNSRQSRKKEDEER